MLLNYRAEQADVGWAVSSGLATHYGDGYDGYMTRGFVDAANLYRREGSDSFWSSVVRPEYPQWIYSAAAAIAEQNFDSSWNQLQTPFAPPPFNGGPG